MARLFVLSGSSIGTTFDLHETSVIGRDGEADLVLREASVSRKHARLVPREEAGAWKVIDLDSSNGVHIDGKRVRSGIVRDGETFTLGEIELRLRDEAADEPEAAASVQAPFEPEEPRVSSAPSAPAKAEPFEIELEGDLTDEIELEFEPAPAPKAPSSAPPKEAAPQAGSGADRAGARASADRDARRQAAVGTTRRATGGSSVTAAATGNTGRPVLQYSQTRRSGVDLQQLPAWKRWLLISLAVAVAGGIGFAAFKMTQTARSQASALDTDVDE